MGKLAGVRERMAWAPGNGMLKVSNNGALLAEQQQILGLTSDKNLV